MRQATEIYSREFDARSIANEWEWTEAAPPFLKGA